MGSIRDFFNSLFGRRDHQQDVGPDDLPRDILEDLMKEPYDGHPKGFTFSWQYPPDDQEKHHHPHHHDHHHHWPGFGPGIWGPFNHHHHPNNQDNGNDDYKDFEGSHPGDLFQEIDELFQNFFQGFPDIGFEPNIPGIELPPNSTEPDTSDERSLREKMLKPDEPPLSYPQDGPSQPRHPFRSPFERFFGGHPQPHQKDLWGPENHGDKDLDTELEDGKMSLDDVLSQNENHPQALNAPESRAYSHSFSSRFSTIMHGNGATETRKTKRDAQGNEEVTVTRALGGQSHTRTYKTDRHGNQEVIEDMKNMDQDELNEFEEKWSQAARNKQGWNQPMIPHHELPHSLYDSVKDFFFPRR